MSVIDSLEKTFMGMANQIKCPYRADLNRCLLKKTCKIDYMIKTIYLKQ